MDQQDRLAARFEEHRDHLRAVAYRMLGSFAEADDAVQEAWLLLSRANTSGLENLGGWLTTVIARVCLNMLRGRGREEPVGVHVPDPVVSPAEGNDPEQRALLADSVGLALLVVLDTLPPAERVAFVLHDMFGLPFSQIAPIVGRSAATTRKLASRARRRVQNAAPVPDTDLDRQRHAVDAFFAATQDGDLDALVTVLDPSVVLRSDHGAGHPHASTETRGAANVAKQAVLFTRLSPFVHPAIVNGTAGAVVAPHGKPYSVMGFTVTHGKITEIDIVAGPERLHNLHLPALANQQTSTPPAQF